MTSSQQILRYTVPGGLFVLVVTVFQYVLHWAWSPQPNIVFLVLANHVLAAAASVLVIGFATYQLYYFFYRPIIPLTLGKTTRDRGGTILEALQGLSDNSLERLEAIYGVTIDIDAPRLNSQRYKNAWHNHNTIVRSLVNAIADSGGTEIKRDYVNLSDIYHTLGACRLVAPLALVSTALYAAASQTHVIEAANLARVLVAAFFVVLIDAIVYYTCHMNRRHTWRTMTKHLQRDLCMWFARQPTFLDRCESSQVGESKWDKFRGPKGSKHRWLTRHGR